MASSKAGDPLLAEQIAYCRAVAREAYPVDVDLVRAVAVALDTARPVGHVLELACGQGLWTELLLRTATRVTAVDAAPEMLTRARTRVGEERVRFIQADLFRWAPDQRYDAVFFGFWLSHVSQERFESFWSMVADSLTPAGRVFFVDDSARTSEELIEGDSSTAIRRRLTDGTSFRVVQVSYTWGAGSVDPTRGTGSG